MQFTRIYAQRVLISYINRDGPILTQIIYVLIDEGQRRVGSPLRNNRGLRDTVLVGKSRKRGGFFGSGDHAAALASCARAENGSLTESSGSFTDSSVLATSEEPGCRAERQQGLMMYKLPKTSGCFMPIRVAP